jgi:hypothetical protein
MPFLDETLNGLVSNPIFMAIVGLAVGGFFVYGWLKNKKKDLPEQKVGYGKRIWTEIVTAHVKRIMDGQGVRPKSKRQFLIGNESMGYVDRYIVAYITPTHKILWRPHEEHEQIFEDIKREVDRDEINIVVEEPNHTVPTPPTRIGGRPKGSRNRPKKEVIIEHERDGIIE